jgi:hypothetical protein
MDRKVIESYVHDPHQLLKDIDLQLEEVAVEDLPLLALDKDQPIEIEVLDGQPKHSVMDIMLNRSKEKVLNICCNQFGYCSARKKYSDTVSLIQAVGDTLVSAYISFPVPIVTVASYCVLSLFLDSACDCE